MGVGRAGKGSPNRTIYAVINIISADEEEAGESKKANRTTKSKAKQSRAGI